MNIYSKIQPGKVLHIINRKSDIKDGRIDFVSPDQFLQCAALKVEAGNSYKAHRHNWRGVSGMRIAQESWVVISGCVKVTLYDLDNSVLHVDVLEQGDVTITLEGGHKYEILRDAIVYEFKTGPYLGQKADKVFI